MRYLRYFIYLALSLFLIACGKRESVLPYEDLSSAPIQTLYNATSMFTDSGRVQMKMEAPMMYNYSREEGLEVFPQGIHSIFMGEMGETNVDLVADSAINIQNEKLMKFYGNVVVKDYRNGDTLYTDALYWDQNLRKIYSNVYVKKVSADLVLEGDGFDADEEMNNVKLRKPRGVIL